MVEFTPLMEGNPFVRNIINQEYGYYIWFFIKLIVSAMIWFLFELNPRLRKTSLLFIIALILETMYNIFNIIGTL